MESTTRPPRKSKFAIAKLTDEENALLDRACGRLRITRTEAVQCGLRRILQRQREIEALRPLT